MPPAKTANTAAKPAAGKRMTKSAIYAELADKTELSKKKVAEVFDALFNLIRREVAKSGPGEFVVPTSLLKVKRKLRPARPERMGTDPRTGEKKMYPAKPATEVIKVMALKSLKSLA